MKRIEAQASLPAPKPGEKPLPPVRLEPVFDNPSQFFWYMTENQVRRYASEELRAWFDEQPATG